MNRIKSHLPWALLCSAVLLSSSPVVKAGSSTEDAGTLLTLALPAVSLGAALLYEDDTEGVWQLGKAMITNLVITEVLKQAVNKRRPDNSDNKSFPSGHTSVAFTSAAFIHERYGWQWSVPAYVAASYVGYSRVQSDRHFTVDVLAGAALGIVSSRYFTTPYGEKLKIQPYANSDGAGVQVEAKW